MKIPLGYTHNFTSTFATPLVFRFHNSIYGLKQTSRSWFNKFRHTLVSFGFCQSKHDYSLLTKGFGISFIVLLIYVDDIVLVGPNIDCIQTVKNHIQNTFKL